MARRKRERRIMTNEGFGDLFGSREIEDGNTHGNCSGGA